MKLFTVRDRLITFVVSGGAAVLGYVLGGWVGLILSFPISQALLILSLRRWYARNSAPRA